MPRTRSKSPASHYIVRLSKTRRLHGANRSVALIEAAIGVDSVSMISPRARGVIRIVRVWEKLGKSACQRILTEAQRLADKWNGVISMYDYVVLVVGFDPVNAHAAGTLKEALRLIPASVDATIEMWHVRASDASAAQLPEVYTTGSYCGSIILSKRQELLKL